jgi:class 3 adenylate cyclase/Tfp pilus assembly protein PilF
MPSHERNLYRRACVMSAIFAAWFCLPISPCGLPCCALYAQTIIQTEAQADSLRSVLQRPPRNNDADTARVHALNALGAYFCRIKAEYDSALALAKEAAELSARLKFAAGEGAAYNVIGMTRFLQGSPSEALKALERSLEIRKNLNAPLDLAHVYNNMGNALSDLGKRAEALERYFTALELAEKHNDRKLAANALNNIAIMTLEQGEYEKALLYHRRALGEYRALGNLQGVARSLNNIASVYTEMGRLEEAFESYKEALALRENIRDKMGAARTLSNMGFILAKQGKYAQALAYQTRSLEAKAALPDSLGMIFSLEGIAESYLAMGQIGKAVEYSFQFLRLAEKIGARDRSVEALFLIARCYESAQNFQTALFYHRQAVARKDSLFTAENARVIAELQEGYEAKARAQEIEALNKEKTLQEREIRSQRLALWSLGAGLLVAVAAAITTGWLYRQKRAAAQEILRQKEVLEEQSTEIELINTALQEAHEQSETLLLNILPAPIAQRLKSGERAIADRFDSVTVLFADIVGFTKLSAQTTPEKLVQGLNTIFERFDKLAKKYNLEKIKTIGDAYMVAGGLPERSEDHSERVAMFALEIQAAMHEESFRTSTGERVQLRIGIHTGAAVAGVIGTSKFSYDLWGDTVNIASRMESHGEAGKIHCSEETYQALKEKFAFEERGEIEIKGRGMMRTRFLVGIIQTAPQGVR